MTRVAYLGPAGTFTEEALWAFNIAGAEPVPVGSPAEALSSMRSGEADFAVVAVENSVDGSVTSTSDALIEAPGVQIYAEHELEIAFAIMTRPGESLDAATRFASHPVAYRQVKGWLAVNAPRATYVPAASNAAGAQMVAEGAADAAAAPRRAAGLFGLEVHAEGVADVAAARTRFVLAGPVGAPPAPTGNDRTSVVFQLPNKPGTLVATLHEFASRGVDLCRIESRPTRETHNTYNFFVDLVGHIEDEPLADALRAVHRRASTLVFLGSWPRHSGEPYSVDHARFAAAAEWVARAQKGL
ncbi:Prephenate dehydratase [Corynebacterium capitovis DSM 44611]|uniref:prephenate dehydratase n=1 Tax=Corynebacterium capitovis TaxID=131081 RepID=UPI00035DCE8A|nr:prephenate dehydratase [Corynebacterium capitovis]WKD58301.1 Prephenate dehydratase [Corynebacterium capitovis DSM 44611]